MNDPTTIAAIIDNMSVDSLDLPALCENIFWILMMVIVISLSERKLLFVTIALRARKIISMGCDEAVSNLEWLFN